MIEIDEETNTRWSQWTYWNVYSAGPQRGEIEPLEAEDEHRLMLEDIETGMFVYQVVVR